MSKAGGSLRVLNAGTATFQCVFPTCGGICCRNGRPSVDAGEVQRISDHLDQFIPQMRPAARAQLEKNGTFVTKRLKQGKPALSVVEGWCLFFNEGCVLHKVGATQGSPWTYKPAACIRFPLDKVESGPEKGEWFVRQHGVQDEAWDLFCLDPAESDRPAAESLAAEIAFLEDVEAGLEQWRTGEPDAGKTRSE